MASNEEKKRTRSPAYPSIDLKEAIRYTKAVYDAEDHHPFTSEAAAEHWEYKPTSSAVDQIISALKQFGLLIEEPSGGVRRARLSPLALDLMVHEDETDPRKSALLKTAALKPRIHREIWDKYGGRLPSDTSLRIYLLREREGAPFNKDRVDRFIHQLRETIEFAKLSESDKLSQEAEEQGSNAVQGMAAKRDAGWAHKPFVSGSKPLMPSPSQLERSKAGRCPVQSGIKEDVFTLEEGQVVLQWPERLSEASFEDFESWLQLVIRKVKRSVSESRSSYGEEPVTEIETEED